MYSTTYRSVPLSDSSGAERSVLGSLSSSSSTWDESPHPTSGAGLRPPLDAWFHRSSVATSFVARTPLITSPWPMEEALKQYRTLAQSRCWLSPSWDPPSLGAKSVSVTAWCGSPLTSQLKTSALRCPCKGQARCLARPDVPVPVRHSCTETRLSVILRQAVVRGWCGPNAWALRWHGLGGVGLQFPSAAVARTLSALPSGAFVAGGPLLPGSGDLSRMWAPGPHALPRPLGCVRRQKRFASPAAGSRHCPPAQAALVPACAEDTTVAACGRGCRRSALVVVSDPQALSSAVGKLESNQVSHAHGL